MPDNETNETSGTSASNESIEPTASNESNATTATTAEDEFQLPTDPAALAAYARETAAKLKAANGEAAANRHKLKEYELKNEDATAKAIREAKEAGELESASKFKPIIIKAQAKAALTTAGASSGLDSLVKLLDSDKLEIDADGDVTGLKEEIDRVKKEFPQLFTASTDDKRRRVAGSRADGGDKAGGAPKLTAAQIHANRALGLDD